MEEYQINVASPFGKYQDGRNCYIYLFRTDWIDTYSDAQFVMGEMKKRFGECSVSLRSRSRVIKTVEEYKP